MLSPKFKANIRRRGVWCKELEEGGDRLGCVLCTATSLVLILVGQH